MQLNREPAGAKADRLLSFVKEHRSNPKLVADHPGLTAMISTGALPLGSLVTLFEAGRNIASGKKDLERHIRLIQDNTTIN